MKNVTEIKSLGDIRTVTSHHVASKPPVKGSTYLDVYLLDKEKQRLEKELSRMELRQERIHERLGEIRKAMDTLKQKAEQEMASDDASPDIGPGQKHPAPAGQHSRGRWKKMALDY